LINRKLTLPKLLIVNNEEILYDGVDYHVSFKANTSKYKKGSQAILWPRTSTWETVITFVKVPSAGSTVNIQYGYSDGAGWVPQWIERTMDGVSNQIRTIIRHWEGN